MGLGLPDDPIPIWPPASFRGLADAAIMTARSKWAMKTIPDWELLAFFAMGPDLVFDLESRKWSEAQDGELTTVRRAARAAAAEGDQARYFALLSETRLRWRRLVQRSIGFKLPRQAPVMWQ